jgi:hypothetical protein
MTFTRDAAYQGTSEIRVEYDIATNGNVISRGGQSRPTPASPAPVVASDASEAVPGVVARTVSKIFWFVGAALFFAQGCAFARAREIANEEEAKKRRGA